MVYHYIVVLIKEDLIIHFDFERSKVKMVFAKTFKKEVEAVFFLIKEFKIKHEERKPSINLLVNKPDGFGLIDLQISQPQLSIEDNYNDDFFATHELIVSRLNQANNKGLVLLHGKPGTVKHLILDI